MDRMTLSELYELHASVTRAISAAHEAWEIAYKYGDAIENSINQTCNNLYGIATQVYAAIACHDDFPYK